MNATPTSTSWRRRVTKSIDCRKKDTIVRIADWTRDKDEPAFDVEIYAGGVYDYDESQTFCTRSAKRTKREARALAVAFAAQQIAKLTRGPK